MNTNTWEERFCSGLTELEAYVETELVNWDQKTATTQIDKILDLITDEDKMEVGGAWIPIRYSTKWDEQGQASLNKKTTGEIPAPVLKNLMKKIIERVKKVTKQKDATLPNEHMVHPLSTAVMTTSKESTTVGAMKRPKIPEWKGIQNPNNLEKEIVEFIQRLEIALEYSQNEIESWRIWKTALIGDARLWLDNYEVGNTNLIQEFLTYFMGKKPALLYRRFSSTYPRKGERWEQFLTRLESIKALLKRCGYNITKEEVANTFCFNLAESTMYGQHMIQYVKLSNIDQNDPRQVRMACLEHEMYKCRRHQPKRDVEEVNVNEVSRRRRNWGEKRCYHCDSEFHLSYSCPEKIKEKEEPDEQNKQDF